MIKADYHTHTFFCDGDNSPRDMIEKAVELGLEYYGFSSHCFTDLPHEILTDEKAYISECVKIRKEYKDRINILIGMEMENLLGKNSHKEVEYTIGSTHYLFVNGQYLCLDYSKDEFASLCKNHFGGDYYKFVKEYYKTEAEVVKNTDCTFIGHFDLITKFNEGFVLFDESDKRYTDPALEALAALKEYEVPFEINTSQFSRKKKSELYPSMFILKKMHEMGCEIIINSDAHSPAMIISGFDEAVSRAKECGFNHVNILTSKGFIQTAI